MLSRLSKSELRHILAIILLPLCLLGGLSGCISNSTTNPSTDDPVVPDPDEVPDDPDPITPPEETVGPTSGLKIISAGGEHNCSIKNEDGSLWCWGNNETGQLGDSSNDSSSNPKSISTELWQTVVTGENHSCGIDEVGALHCWGKNDSGQLGNGSTTDENSPTAISINSDWSDVSLGSSHSCAIKNIDELWCWGSNTFSQLGHSSTNTRKPSLLIKTNDDETTTTENWIATASGDSHTCAIKADQSLWCWGGNSSGQLGQGTTVALIAEPTEVAADSQWSSVSANGDHSCAIKTGNSLWCWGSNSSGQIGNNADAAIVSSPTEIAAGSSWSKISLGTDHSCGIKDDDSLWCWGGNSHGQLGDGSKEEKKIPTAIDPGNNDWLAISLGTQFSCGIRDVGSLFCWGINDKNQSGRSPIDKADLTTPSSVDGNTDWLNISTGNTHSCGIRNTDQLWCWGDSSYGQTGAESAATPTLVVTPTVGDDKWIKVAADGNHSCAIRKNNNQDNSLWCWGKNDNGQLGNNTTTAKTQPAPVVGDSVWSWVSLGVDHSCAINDDGSLWCWGDNSESQLGDTTINNHTIPKQIGTETTWSSISLGNQFSCGIQTDLATPPNQTLWCWGNNGESQLGDSTTINSTSPKKIISLADKWTTIDAGSQHACAINSNSLYCWGNNSYGQLGLNSTANATIPTQEVEGRKWLGVSSGANHTCAVEDTGTDTLDLWCWGANEFGQLGIGSTSHYPKPHLVTHNDSLGWRWVSSGTSHTCAINSDYIGHCWGLNNSGQLGNGIGLDTGSAKQFDSSNNWQSLASGALHSCGLKTDPFTSLETLWCGGINNFGQLGIGSTANQSAPVQVTGPDDSLENWEYVSSGHFHSCAITNTAALYCWGRNKHGQLANGNTTDIPANWSLQSKITEGADDWLIVAAGASHTCGIKNTNELWCWGDNATDQMGLENSGATPTQTSPIQVMEDGAAATTPFTAIDVAVGGYTVEPAIPPNVPPNHSAGGHTCAIKTDGTLWCWGENDASQLGDQTIIDKTLPTQIVVDTAAHGLPPQFNNSWVSVQAGNRFTCGLQTDEHLYCWGDNTFGQTGTEPKGVVPVPVPVTSVSLPTAIDGNLLISSYAVGQNAVCVITTDSERWCWGFYGSSQAALDADTASKISLSPARQATDKDWQNLTMGMTHGCGIREDDQFNRRAYCWGDDAEIHFGDGSAWKETPQKLPLE